MAITRLAPSPTGALHLGNARTFLVNWMLARKHGWEVHLRIEDLDGPRIKAGAATLLLEDLEYLGLDWDVGPVFQSKRLGVYRAAIELLIERGTVYPCVCSRREIELAASAPHAEDGAAVYPRTCRGKFKSIAEAREQSGREPALRFAAADRTVEFDDQFLGHQTFNVARELGDFVVAKADGTPAYQLAVVVDDIAAGVSEVVRGDDLLDSTPRQMLLYEALEASDRVPRYTHLPLVVGTDGRRLAKRHGDTRIATYRELGVPAERLRALLARWCGMGHDSGAMRDLRQLAANFELGKLPRERIVFTEQDDAELRGGAR